jgi:hypothetical protein
MTELNDKMKEDILLARRMFFAGCLGLPWLWICNALYYRLRVFGPMVAVDYWPGRKSPRSSGGGGGGGDGEEEGENNVNREDGTVDDDDDDDDERLTLEQRLERQGGRKELEKWVKRSTRGAFAVVTLFVAWIVAFQVNREHFGPNWFVMDQTDAEVSGW